MGGKEGEESSGFGWQTIGDAFRIRKLSELMLDDFEFGKGAERNAAEVTERKAMADAYADNILEAIAAKYSKADDQPGVLFISDPSGEIVVDLRQRKTLDIREQAELEQSVRRHPS